MQRRYAPGLAALILLLVVSIALKYLNTLAASAPDIQRMRGELVTALATAGYDATLPTGEPQWWTGGLVTGRKDGCTLFLRDATYFGPELEAISSRRMNDGRPLRYIWNGRYIDQYPRIRIEIYWRIQRELARLGWRYGIDPVIAVGTPDNCWPNAAIFADVQIYYKP